MKQTLTIDELLESDFLKNVPEESLVLTSSTSTIDYSHFQQWSRDTSDEKAIMIRLLPLAANFARPPISNFKVGAIAQGLSGNLYFGANMEFTGDTLSFSIHAEQSAINNAWLSGETGLKAIAINAAPCGYCRQFLNELPEQNPELTILLKKDKDLFSSEFEEKPLEHFLPEAFGPADLDISDRLMLPVTHEVKVEGEADLEKLAISAASKSYVPYTQCIAGVAIETRDGRKIAGRYAENAAYNPSLSPMHSALSQLNLNTPPDTEFEVKSVVLAERVMANGASQRRLTESMVNAVQPDAEFSYIAL